MSYYREQLESWLKELDVKADKVFDVGGAQLPVKDRVKSWEVGTYKILDLPEYDIETTHAFFGSGGDIVFCLEVFEYLINPLNALCNIRRLLKPGGKAYITFPFVYPHHNELHMDSLRYTESGIKRLSKTAMLEIANTWYRIDRSGLLNDFYSADGMRRAKEYPHHNVTGFIIEFMRLK